MVCVLLDIDRYLGCSQPLATGNDTSISILGNIFWWTNILSSLGQVPKNGSAEFMHGISTVMDYLAYLVSEDYGAEFEEKFLKNMIESEKKVLTTEQF